MTSDPTSCDCLLDRNSGGTGYQVATLPKHLPSFSLREGDASRLCLGNITASRLSPLLHFSAESLWPRLTGTAINPVKTALCYLLYLVFY